jgi:hypothetical protein
VVYAEDERSRLRWVAGLMLANWLVINSGTAKEAYMVIAVLNAIGMLHFMLEKSRFGGKFKTWSGLLAASGVCFLMIAAPVWGTLFDTLGSGMSNYDSPGVQQYPFWFFLGFVDNFYYLLRTDSYSPAVNALLFVGFLRGFFAPDTWPAHLTGYLWLAFGGLALWLAALILFWKYRQREGADTTSPPRELMASLAGTRDDRGLRLQG